VEIMGLPEDGGGVFGVVNLERPGPFELPVERDLPRFNLWIHVDQDGDTEPEYHILHPASPLTGPAGPDAPLDLGLSRGDLTQEYPARLPIEPVPYYLPDGYPVRGELSLEGGLEGCVQLNLVVADDGPQRIASVLRRCREGPFRIDAPVDAAALALTFQQDVDSDGSFDRLFDPALRVRPTPGGVQLPPLRIALEDWQPFGPGMLAPPVAFYPAPEP